MSQRWVDNFHTGYNLIALRRLAEITGGKDCDRSVRKGFEFYIKHFFTEEGIAKYYHDRIHPIDIHAVAQSIITLVELRDLQDGDLELAHNVFQWAWDHMRNPAGYYYFQVGRFAKRNISYMRWSQAWMLLSLVVLAQASDYELDDLVDPQF